MSEPTEERKLTPQDNIETPPEYEVNLDDLVEQGRQVKHIWVDRGAKMSCEGAQHPHHSHFKVAKSVRGIAR
jgi:hypothetical protein